MMHRFSTAFSSTFGSSLDSLSNVYVLVDMVLVDWTYSTLILCCAFTIQCKWREKMTNNVKLVIVFA